MSRVWFVTGSSTGLATVALLLMLAACGRQESIVGKWRHDSGGRFDFVVTEEFLADGSYRFVGDIPTRTLTYEGKWRMDGEDVVVDLTSNKELIKVTGETKDLPAQQVRYKVRWDGNDRVIVVDLTGTPSTLERIVN